MLAAACAQFRMPIFHFNTLDALGCIETLDFEYTVEPKYIKLEGNQKII